MKLAIPLGLATCLCVLGFATPALAVPEQGFYVQGAPGLGEDLQAVAGPGALQLDYAPTVLSPGGYNMQILRLAGRVPLPLLRSPIALRGLIGYQQLWAFYGGGAEDTDGGISGGLTASFKITRLPRIGDYLPPITLSAYGLDTRLITAKAQGASFPTGSMDLPSFGFGLAYQLPNRSSVYVGYESWEIPAELGSGSPGFSGALRAFRGATLGYRW